MKIYAASSWRNDIQPIIVAELRKKGYEVYDFRNPLPGNFGFHWSDIDPAWKNWTPEQFKKALNHPIAEGGFALDMNALRECDVCILILTSGRSAHLEAGYAIGAGKPTIILLQNGEPELMYKMTPYICLNLDEVLDCLTEIQLKWFRERRSNQELECVGISTCGGCDDACLANKHVDFRRSKEAR